MGRIIPAMAFIFLIALFFTPEDSNANVFDCESTSPQYLIDSFTMEFPLVFIGNDDIYKNLFVEFIPGDTWDEGSYRILRGDNIPQVVKCGGFSRSDECPAIKELMCN